MPLSQLKHLSKRSLGLVLLWHKLTMCYLSPIWETCMSWMQATIYHRVTMVIVPFSLTGQVLENYIEHIHMIHTLGGTLNSSRCACRKIYYVCQLTSVFCSGFFMSPHSIRPDGTIKHSGGRRGGGGVVFVIIEKLHCGFHCQWSSRESPATTYAHLPLLIYRGSSSIAMKCFVTALDLAPCLSPLTAATFRIWLRT